jgi:hypothetical protein
MLSFRHRERTTQTEVGRYLIRCGTPVESTAVFEYQTRTAYSFGGTVRSMRWNDPDRPDSSVGTTSRDMADDLVGGLRDRSSSESRYRWLLVLGLVVCSLAAVPVVSAHAVGGPSLPNGAPLLRLSVPTIEGIGVLAGVNLFEPIARGLLYASLVVLVGVPLALDTIVRPVLGTSERLPSGHGRS